MLHLCSRPSHYMTLGSRIRPFLASTTTASSPITTHQLRSFAIMGDSKQQQAGRFSSGTDETTALPALQALLSPSQTVGGDGAASGVGGRWTLTKEGEALERTFKFKTFTKTWDFMTAVSLQCKIKNHHPEWSNVYNTTFIRWTTHNPKGLSHKDLELAALCDAIARDFGELDPEPASCAVVGLADRVVEAGGDCCTPKK